jgi:hypothetical protein
MLSAPFLGWHKSTQTNFLPNRAGEQTPKKTQRKKMKVSIQFNGNAIALRIDGNDEQERQQTLNRFVNHDAIDANDAARDASGAIILTTTRARFTRGVANWLQFIKENKLASGGEFLSAGVRAIFQAKAERFVLELPEERILNRENVNVNTYAEGTF